MSDGSIEGRRRRPHRRRSAEGDRDPFDRWPKSSPNDVDAANLPRSSEYEAALPRACEPGSASCCRPSP